MTKRGAARHARKTLLEEQTQPTKHTHKQILTSPSEKQKVLEGSDVTLIPQKKKKMSSA